MITYFLDLYDLIYNYFTSVNAGAIVLILKIFSWLVSILLMWMIVVLLKRSDAAWWVKERVFAAEFAYGKAAGQRWDEIKARLQKGDEANLKLAVIEADNLMDDILKRMGLPGANMEERLRQIERQEIKSVEKIWATRKTRNQIVHEPNFHLAQEEAEAAVANIEEALKELEYLS
ncbi:hypothetical protein KJ665_03270 [Patescibacteria group bacterium]|nr:hypothetical protein [Patescibacteria group bacterium]